MDWMYLVVFESMRAEGRIHSRLVSADELLHNLLAQLPPER